MDADFELAREDSLHWLYRKKGDVYGREIRVRKTDGKVHGTDLVKSMSGGLKRFDNFLQSVRLSVDSSAVPGNETVTNGLNELRGTWLDADTVDKAKKWAAKPTNIQIEHAVQKRLARDTKGAEREVKCPAGVVDLVRHSPPVIVEVKELKGWKEGIGQLMVYGQYFPGYERRLHLFRTSKMNWRMMDIIEESCNKNGIDLILDEEFYDDV